MLDPRKSAAIVLTASIGVAGAASAADVPPNTVDSDGLQNTAMGSGAMGVTTSGTGNTAAGSDALDSDNAGSSNTAVGASAMTANNDGDANVAVGFQALLENNASNNVALGYQALRNNTTGHQNGANGYQALYSNTSGSNNLATGANSLRSNISGGGNIGFGVATLQNLTNGQNNLAIGTNALNHDVSGSSNTAIGPSAGFNITGKNNIDIGNEGAAGESGVIRIGTSGTQTEAIISGIAGVHITGAAVYVTSSGQLGVLASAERYKTSIEPIGSNSDKLDQLRPVTFHLKNDPNGAVQYGLIAEEVAKVYPDLVIHDETGRIDSVRYDELAPLLLSQMQKDRQEMQRQAAEIRDLKQQTAEITTLKQQMAEMVAAMAEAHDARVAKR
jgi:Chaperone of endosialidase